jgi:hypothetical protein
VRRARNDSTGFTPQQLRACRSATTRWHSPGALKGALEHSSHVKSSDFR